jgi:hypothetical protein
MDRWGQYFKPAGMGGSGSATGSNTQAAAPKAAPAPTPAVDEDDVPFEQAAPAPAQKVAEAQPASEGSTASARAQDILAMIRNRQKSE